MEKIYHTITIAEKLKIFELVERTTIYNTTKLSGKCRKYFKKFFFKKKKKNI